MPDYLKHIPEHLTALTAYQPGKTSDEIKRTHSLEHIVKLASNENPLGPSPKVKQAVSDFISEITRYPEDSAPHLKQALAAAANTTPEQITLGSGSSEIFEMLARLFLRPGDNLIVSEHAFVLYTILAKAVGAESNIIADQHYQQDTPAMLAAIGPQTRMIMLANPNNPTGTWLDKDTLFDFIRQVPRDVIVVIDEAYSEYMQDTAYASAAPLIAECSNLVVVRTFSKAYGLAGMRCGYAISSAPVADLLSRLRKPFNVSSITLVAALAAFEDQAHLQQVISANAQGREQLAGFFKNLGLPIIAASCNFITVEIGERAADVAAALLKQGVIVRSLAPYNMPHHLRISIGTAAENEIFMRKLADCL
jgi:histidinol-phosphate aminotransferase